MKEKFLWLLNLFLIVSLSIFLASVQTALWFHIFGAFPAPQLWLIPVLHVSLFRSFKSFLPAVYLMSFAVSAASTIAPSVAMLSGLIVGQVARVFKERVFWGTATYAMLVAGGATFAFHLIQWIAHAVMTQYELGFPDLVSWITQSLITPLFAPAFMKVCAWIDRLTGQSEPAEQMVGAGAL